MEPVVLIDDSSSELNTSTSTHPPSADSDRETSIELPNIPDASWLGLVKAYQPVGETGAVKHSLYWLLHFVGLKTAQDRATEIASESSKKVAVYFIHGTFDQASGCSDLKDRLAKVLPEADYDLRIVAFKNRYSNRSIDHYAHQLRTQILSNRDQRVILIGHSRGGLVASYFAESIAPHCGVDVPLVATVGTPFGGSIWASIVSPFLPSGSSIQQMRPGSDFLDELGQKVKASLAEKRRVYRFYMAKRDWLVSGNASAVEMKDETMVTQYKRTLGRHSHLSVMSSHRLVKDLHALILEVTTKPKVTEAADGQAPSPTLKP